MADELDEMLREPAVLKAKGGSRSKLWQDVREGNFPKPVKAGPRITGWWKSEVVAHQMKLKASRDGGK
jgi:prophage regulatory protein